MSNRGQYVLPGAGPLLREVPLPPMPPPEDDREPETVQMVIQLDHGRLGPFYAQITHVPGHPGTYHVVPVAAPEADT